MSRIPVLMLISFVTVALQAEEQSSAAVNLVEPNQWQPSGNARTESRDGVAYFTIHNKGSFYQDVPLPNCSEGKFVVMTALTASERINPNGSITGLPYIHGYMMGSKPHFRDPNQMTPFILDHMGGVTMRCAATKPNEAACVYGLFPILEGSYEIRFFLNQAECRGDPQNGSAARFSRVGLFLFKTEREAKVFIEKLQKF